MQVEEQLKAAFADLFGVMAPANDNTLEDLGLDSLDHVELSIEIEARLGVEFEVDEIEATESFGDLVQKVAAKC